MKQETYPIYLDYAASTPLDPSVLAVMKQCLEDPKLQGNSGSLYHRYGWQAQEVITLARAQAASLLNASVHEIIWTSGATESINLALLGLSAHLQAIGKTHIITSLIEHQATLSIAEALERLGFEVSYLKPDPMTGAIHADDLSAAFKPTTGLVSLMHVNNETGAINNIHALGRLIEVQGAYFHVDAAQSLGKLPLDVQHSAIHLLSGSGHKLYAPKGIGLLYVKQALKPLIQPLIHGGGQEFGLRSGTLPTHQVVGFGQALAMSAAQQEADFQHVTALMNRLKEGLRSIGACFNSPEDHWAGILNLYFSGIDAEVLLATAKEIAASPASACKGVGNEASHVLLGMGKSRVVAESSIRLSIGRMTLVGEIDETIIALARCLKILKPS